MKIKLATPFLLVFISALNSFALAQEFTITVDRNMTCMDETTVGRMLVNGKEIGRTLELPWKGNNPGISRVPEGRYSAFIRSEGEKRWRVELEDVPERSNVQIHVGNYYDQTEGCILVGSDVTNDGERCMVPYSRATLETLADEMARFAEDLGQNYSSEIEIVVEIQ